MWRIFPNGPVHTSLQEPPGNSVTIDFFKEYYLIIISSICIQLQTKQE